MLNKLLDVARSVRDDLEIPIVAKQERRRDRREGLGPDHGIERSVTSALAWLQRAQDYSASNDGGVARHFSLVSGWSASYPETTGYIIPTMIAAARSRNDVTLHHRARRMLDWLVSIQFPEGGFQGGVIGQTPVVPVTFNTGQILLGLAAGATEYGDPYLEPMRRAATWLVETQDPDGAWRRYGSPFAKAGEKAYETHVSWGLFEAARVHPEPTYVEAAVRNVRWAMTKQLTNGWFDNNYLTHPSQSLTHTIGYVVRGLLEAYRYTQDQSFFDAARKTADALLGVIRLSDGFLPGRFDDQWRGTVDWVCLTGSVQIAYCWLMLYQITGESRYLAAGKAANRYVRRTVRLDAQPEQCGGIKGAFPVSGEYGRYEYLNWACKFFIDSNVLEQEIDAATTQHRSWTGDATHTTTHMQQ